VYSLVKLKSLNTFDKDSDVTPQELLSAGLIKTLAQPVKILADGDIDRPLKVKAHKFSVTARAKIEAAGGSVEEVAYAAEGG
jgi:large subunit ribosomal protein L15